MLLASIPFDYATLLDRGDRVRRTPKHTSERRVRPAPPKPLEDR